MSLRLETKKKLLARSDRVKCVDLHPTEPWVLVCLYTGHVHIWNYMTQTLVKSFEVTDQLPVRVGRFIARKQWFVCGSDDMLLRVYNYNTMEKVKVIEAHTDYIRSIAVHPTLPYVLSSSDDTSIKMWDWEKGWSNTMIFEGHTHYVMNVVFNPKDPNTFATASLDHTIKVWGISSPQPYFTLEGHEKGVNYVEYYHGGDKPYLISGSDDRTAKVWDYQTKSCVQTLEGHSHNVTVCAFHPELPLIITGSEDGSVRLWHSTTFRLENTLNYGLERVWAVGYARGTQKLALGYDEGTVVLKLGKERPVVSMDQSGKVILANSNEISQMNLKTAVANASSSDDASSSAADGERLSVPSKELGNCEVYPQHLKHDSNGRFVVVCGQGEYIIYTAIAWRNKSFGKALDVVWGTESGQYCTRESTSRIQLFANFAEKKTFKPAFPAECIYGGPLLAIRSNDFVVFYDMQECRIIRRIDVVPKNIYWNEAGDLVCIACESSFYILRYHRDVVEAALAAGQVNEDGVDDSFELVHEINDRVRDGQWIGGECFLFTSGNNRLNYCIGGEVITLSHLDRTMYLLGFVSRDNRVYLIDKERSVVSFRLNMSVLDYEMAIVRQDMAAAERFLPTVPREFHNRLARFLETQGHRELALSVTTDPEHRFELAMQLNKLSIAHDIARSADSESKWKQLGDAAVSSGDLGMAREALQQGGDMSGLMLLFSSTGDAEGMQALATQATDKGKFNVAFMSRFLLGDIEGCLDLLCSSGRIPEAAFMARSYAPQHIARIVKLWKQDLSKTNKKAAEALASPDEFPNLFPEAMQALSSAPSSSSSTPDSLEIAEADSPVSVEVPQPQADSPVSPIAPVSPAVSAEKDKPASPARAPLSMPLSPSSPLSEHSSKQSNISSPPSINMSSPSTPPDISGLSDSELNEDF